MGLSMLTSPLTFVDLLLFTVVPIIELPRYVLVYGIQEQLRQTPLHPLFLNGSNLKRRRKAIKLIRVPLDSFCSYYLLWAPSFPLPNNRLHRGYISRYGRDT